MIEDFCSYTAKGKNGITRDNRANIKKSTSLDLDKTIQSIPENIDSCVISDTNTEIPLQTAIRFEVADDSSPKILKDSKEDRNLLQDLSSSTNVTYERDDLPELGIDRGACNARSLVKRQKTLIGNLGAIKRGLERLEEEVRIQKASLRLSTVDAKTELEKVRRSLSV